MMGRSVRRTSDLTTLYPSSQGHTGAVYCVSVTVDGLRAVSGSDDKTLRVWANDIIVNISINSSPPNN